MGWYRARLYYKHRLGRMKGSPYNIAAGFASGAAVSCTPFFGAHFIMAVMLAFMVRGALVPALLGTAFGNFWTFPFILYLSYKIGSYFLAMEVQEDISIGVDNIGEYFLPICLGSIPLAIVTWVTFFFPIRDLVYRYQNRRRRRIQKALLKRRALLKKERDSKI